MKYSTLSESKQALRMDWRNVLNCDCSNPDVVSFAIDCSSDVLRLLPITDVVYDVLKKKMLDTYWAAFYFNKAADRFDMSKVMDIETFIEDSKDQGNFQHFIESISIASLLDTDCLKRNLEFLADISVLEAIHHENVYYANKGNPIRGELLENPIFVDAAKKSVEENSYKLFKVDFAYVSVEALRSYIDGDSFYRLCNIDDSYWENSSFRQMVLDLMLEYGKYRDTNKGFVERLTSEQLQAIVDNCEMRPADDLSVFIRKYKNDYNNYSKMVKHNFDMLDCASSFGFDASTLAESMYPTNHAVLLYMDRKDVTDKMLDSFIKEFPRYYSRLFKIPSIESLQLILDYCAANDREVRLQANSIVSEDVALHYVKSAPNIGTNSYMTACARAAQTPKVHAVWSKRYWDKGYDDLGDYMACAQDVKAPNVKYEDFLRECHADMTVVQIEEALRSLIEVDLEDMSGGDRLEHIKCNPADVLKLQKPSLGEIAKALEEEPALVQQLGTKVDAYIQTKINSMSHGVYKFLNDEQKKVAVESMKKDAIKSLKLIGLLTGAYTLEKINIIEEDSYLLIPSATSVVPIDFREHDSLMKLVSKYTYMSLGYMNYTSGVYWVNSTEDYENKVYGVAGPDNDNYSFFVYSSDYCMMDVFCWAYLVALDGLNHHVSSSSVNDIPHICIVTEKLNPVLITPMGAIVFLHSDMPVAKAYAKLCEEANKDTLLCYRNELLDKAGISKANLSNSELWAAAITALPAFTLDPNSECPVTCIETLGHIGSMKTVYTDKIDSGYLANLVNSQLLMPTPHEACVPDIKSLDCSSSYCNKAYSMAADYADLIPSYVNDSIMNPADAWRVAFKYLSVGN